MKWFHACLCVCLLILLSTDVRADPPIARGEDIHVYLITLGPGTEPWEKFGHDFIDIEYRDQTMVIKTADGPLEVPRADAYNWGVFNFGEGFRGLMSFSWRFVRGKLLYSLANWPTIVVEQEYVDQGRYVLKQELNLTADQKINLVHRLEANDTDATRYYLYDYFVRNCSTMARDAIDAAVDGRVHDTLSKIQSGTTYRWHDRRTTADTIWLYVFLDYALGHAVDQPLSAWQESFLPQRLADHLRHVMVPGPGGSMVPLVKSETVLGVGTFPERTVPPNFFWGFLGTGISLGAILGIFALLGARWRVARWTFALIGMIWSLLLGLLGLLSSFSYLTDHTAAKWNENWFQGNVLSLLLVVLIPFSRKWPHAARKVSLMVLGLSALGLLAKATPWFYQINGQIIAAALPVHIAIACGVVRLSRISKTQITVRQAAAVPAI